MDKIFIPINEVDGDDSRQAVKLSLKALPESVEDLMTLLYGESVSLDLWLDLAYAYRKSGKIQQAIELLEDGTSEGSLS